MSSGSQIMHTGVEQVLSDRLKEHGLLEIAELGVHVRQGIAYIEGYVPNFKQKKLAGEIASQVEGIRDVVNMLRIAPLSVMDDQGLKKRIKRLFARNPRIDENKISVEVMDGIVYLGGFVNTVTEGRLAELEVWSAAGVRDIINRIEVLSTEPRGDIQIVGEIMEGLSACLGLDLSKIEVDCRDGVVHLRGTVPTDYLKEAAEELATWTPSVTNVVSELKVLELPGFRGYSLPRLARTPAEDCSRNVSTVTHGSRQDDLMPASQWLRGVAAMPARSPVNRNVRVARRGYLLPHGEPIAVTDIWDALIIKEGNLFLMTNVDGNVPQDSMAGYGLYKGDTRYLSVYDLSFDGIRPVVLLSTAELGYSSEHHLTNPPMTTAEGRSIPKESLELRRQRVINESLLETIQVTNFNIFRTTVNLRFDFDADFVDIFEVRGERRQKRGKLASPVVGEGEVTFKYKGLDAIWRNTKIKFSPIPGRLWHNGALFSFSLGHRESVSITVTINTDGIHKNGHFPGEFRRQTASYREWLNSSTQVFTNNEFFNAMLERSLKDIRLLMANSGDGRFVTAGCPWFNCLFGRDSIITALQTLFFNPEIARNSLRLLARWQGKELDEWRDEEPGKILHELRTGEMATLGEIPMNPYYGTVDATPLFLMLAAEYVAWTGDLDLIRELESNLLAALEWIDNYGDSDRCGYVEYCKRSPKGLLNQGWKDSRNGIVNSGGTLVRPPIALVEVQGYVYAAKRGMAWLSALLGKKALARRLQREATALKARFNKDFWLEEEEFYALALGANKEPARTITSNPGQCLWTEIVNRDKAARVVERLFSNDMFSGWGIRTLSSEAARYNPLGYHLGSIWPHDNSLIGMGLKRYGFEHELNELTTALYECCRSFDYYRLPELLCGVPRTTHSAPVRYPCACRPQAWAAGSLLLLLQAILGVIPNAPRKELKIVRPKLPYWLEQVEVRNLRVGDSIIDLLFERHRGQTKVSVLSDGGVKVSVTKRGRD